MINLNCQMLGCMLIIIIRSSLSECNAETPPELQEIVTRWKSSCFGKEFEVTGLGTRDLDSLQKNPFDGRNEKDLYTMRSTLRCYANGIVLKGVEAIPGGTLVGMSPGTTVWLNGRTTFHQVRADNQDEVVVVDLPDPKGSMLPSRSVGMIAAIGVVTSTTIDDFLKSYQTWDPPKSELTLKRFRGKSANGSIEVAVETKTHPVITQLLGSIRFNRPNDGLPIKVEYAVFFRYENPSPYELIPTFAESRMITTGKGLDSRNSQQFTLSTAIASAKPLTKLSDGLPDIENGTRVQVNDHPGIEFEWREGEIVRKIDRNKVASLRGFKFSGVKWLLPGILLLVTGAVGLGWWRWSRSK